MARERRRIRTLFLSHARSSRERGLHVCRTRVVRSKNSGGFSPEYMFTHFEDADLCLKSFSAGKPAWLHYLPFVHFEGKGSVYRPVHASGRVVNRWHFTKLWAKS